MKMKKIKIQYIPCSEKLVVHADADMVKTIIRNFLSNAVKFTPEDKGIEVSCTREGGMAKISVRDHGVGISPERLENIFRKGETTYGTGGEEGSGLGLQLCQDFAQKNGGEAVVESVLGEGSTFSVLVPLKQES